jgi:hypothetical protein
MNETNDETSSASNDASSVSREEMTSIDDSNLQQEETKIVQTHVLYGMESVLTNPVAGDPEATLTMAVPAGMHHRGKKLENHQSQS